MSDLCPEGYDKAERGPAAGKGYTTACPNMKPVEGDRSMDYEHYECKVCGHRDRLDYEEMR